MTQSIPDPTDSPEQPHPSRMTVEQLRDLVWAMSSAALDLGQHLSWLNEVTHNDPEVGYVQAQRMAYTITQMPYSPLTPDTGIDVGVYGADGLTKVPMTWDDLRGASSEGASSDTDEEQGR